MNKEITKTNRGQFKPGTDPRRHQFTTEECSRGFWAAVKSVATRYPDAVSPDGRHMTCNLLLALQARAGQARRVGRG